MVEGLLGDLDVFLFFQVDGIVELPKGILNHLFRLRGVDSTMTIADVLIADKM
jgi:hypothetical protein